MTAATTIATLNAASPPPDLAELVPQNFDPDQIVTLADNPPPSPAVLAYLEPNIRELGQLVPGWVCPSPELPEEKRVCLEGHARLAVARLLGRTFWAFDLGRFVPEEERIRLTFSHNHIRRRMSREEIAERAARWMEITGKTQDEAARLLNVSPPTLSRAFGEKRILPELQDRAALLGLSIRSLVAATPPELMPQAVDFALTPREDGKHQTRDQVAAFIGQLKKGKRSGKGRKVETITVQINGRTLAFSVGEADSAATVAEDLKAVIDKLRKELADVRPEGWPYHFER